MILKYFSSCSAALKIILRDTGLILWQCYCHLILFGGEESQRKTIECILLQTFDCSPSSDLQLSYCPQFLLFIININLNSPWVNTKNVIFLFPVTHCLWHFDLCINPEIHIPFSNLKIHKMIHCAFSQAIMIIFGIFVTSWNI